MFRLLKINLIIFIILSFPLLGKTENQNKEENFDIWRQSTKSYIKNFNNLTGAFTQIDHAAGWLAPPPYMYMYTHNMYIDICLNPLVCVYT